MRRCAIISLAGFILASLGCGHSAKPEDTSAKEIPLPTITVTTVPLQTRSVQRTVTAVGTFRGYDEVTLSPKVDGVINTVHVDVGDMAIPGAVLLTIDPTDCELAVWEAHRALDAELARLGIPDLPDTQVNVDQVSTVVKARVSLDNATKRFAMRRGLFDRQVLAKEEYDLAETDYKLAEATYRDAVTQARAVLAQARLRKAVLDTATQRLRDCQLRVPEPPGFGAWAAVVGPGFVPVRYAVAKRLVSEGQRVISMPVTDAFRLVITHALKLRVDVPERFVSAVRLGQTVDIRVEAHPQETFRGQVTRISPTVDVQNRTFQVEIAVPNLDGRLRVGGFAHAAIRTRMDAAVPVVPPSALITFAGVTKLFVIADGKAKPIEVATGTQDRDWIEIVTPLPPDARIITSGHTQLVAGSPVQIRD
ncbi:MAG: efflux RND transporter periplasmic adaptor subunit [Bacteroidales bacterium]|nr:efflux RND transporter periplasmic adaptor subunit [Bacteroidales bacterium]